MRGGAFKAFSFPKSARLLRTADFSFRPFQRFETPLFKIIVGPKGQGRIGISISKKVLRRAVARNRVRRLLKEAFRLHRSDFEGFDLHIIALPELANRWQSWGRSEGEAELELLLTKISRRRVASR